MSNEKMDREAALLLLESQHTFPGPFPFRVVVMPHAKTAVVSGMVAAAGPGAKVVDVGEKASRKGNYLSLRVSIELESAAKVLSVYDVLKNLDGVLMTL